MRGRDLDEIAEDAVVTDLQRADIGLADEAGLQRGNDGASLGGEHALGIELRVVAVGDEVAVAGEKRWLVVDGGAKIISE